MSTGLGVMDFVLFLLLTVLLCGWLDQSPTTERPVAGSKTRVAMMAPKLRPRRR
ncbi:hypothetical protein [Dactylosporangium sp. NPDC006015]|uniref:hypothetical protein n=1 Tax=Dactylosporangium sp. NPDC006015 TaxID=3154576 RepID=UPI0033AD0356